MMNHQDIVGADALIGPLFDRLTVKLARSGNGPYIINFNFFTKDSILLIDIRFCLGP